MASFHIDSVVILDPNPGRIAEVIGEKRRDIRLFVGGGAPVPDKPFAVAAFDPGECINRFADAAWVHCNGAGVDKLMRAMTFTPPRMSRTVGRMGEQMAEYVMAYVLRDAQKMGEREAAQRQGEWDKIGMLPRFLAGERAIIFGTGHIAQEVAKRFSAFGIICDGVSRSGRPKAPFARVATPETLHSLSPQSASFVVLALPNHASTKRLVGCELLSQFAGAQLINIGRGEVLDTGAVIAALDGGHLREAVLDVFEEEPLPSSSPLWGHPGVVVTPHVSGVTLPEDAATAFLDSLDALESGREVPHPVDPVAGY